MTETAHDALALLATEWFKTSRRALRLTNDTAPARMERERAQLAYSTRRVGEALASHGIHYREYKDEPYSPSIPAEPVNPEDFETEEGLCILETVEPTVLHEGRILMRGKVVLGKAA